MLCFEFKSHSSKCCSSLLYSANQLSHITTERADPLGLASQIFAVLRFWRDMLLKCVRHNNEVPKLKNISIFRLVRVRWRFKLGLWGKGKTRFDFFNPSLRDYQKTKYYVSKRKERDNQTQRSSGAVDRLVHLQEKVGHFEKLDENIGESLARIDIAYIGNKLCHS